MAAVTLTVNVAAVLNRTELAVDQDWSNSNVLPLN